MIINDSVYGTIEITEPVIVDLINSRPIQRLKKIDQAGYFEPHFPGSKHTRFEHSVGVYFLLKKYNASLEEQIAGLIHDVSHLAFSHCADYVLNQEFQDKQNLQDNIFNEFVLKSEIPEILKKYNLEVEFILEEKNFPLLETNLPDLCADRIDYSLRSAAHYLNYSQEQLDQIFNNLEVIDNQWIFQDKKSAKDFASLFDKLNEKYWCGLPSAQMFYSLSEYLLYALKKKYIEVEDLYQDDDFVLEKIEKFHDQDDKLKELFNIMSNADSVKNDLTNYHREILCKSRVVDPLFVKDGNVVRLSKVDEKWQNVVIKNIEPKKYFLSKK